VGKEQGKIMKNDAAEAEQREVIQALQETAQNLAEQSNILRRQAVDLAKESARIRAVSNAMRTKKRAGSQKRLRQKLE
jgi:hypothetical protein